jgi:ATP-dependent Clp protease ATP-binding subunit ClpC
MPEISPYSLLGIALVVAAYIIYQRSAKSGGAGAGGGASLLQKYTRDLTADAAAEKLDPVVGREEEIERVVHILSRRRKNNPLLLGEPGVGKTAVVEGLARRIHKGYVPETLKNKRVLALDLTSMVSGTKYRGELEQRTRQLTREIEALGRSVILFMDEVHVIEQTAGAEGSMNISDILKPALARGDLQAVGATTWREFEKYIKPDDALNRRFQPVLVGEPSREATLEILRGVRSTYETYHGVKIDDEALEAAVDLSKKIKDRYLPDKAIDLIDEACAKVAIEALGSHAAAIGMVHAAAGEARRRREAELKKLKPVIGELEKLDREFPDDMEIERAERVLKRHAKEIEEGAKTEIDRQNKPLVNKEDIAEVVQEWLNAA